MSSACYFCKQFGPRSGPTKRRAWSGSKLFDTLIVFLKEFFEIVNFEKNQQTTKKKHETEYPACKELNSLRVITKQLKDGMHKQTEIVPDQTAPTSWSSLICGYVVN